MQSPITLEALHILDAIDRRGSFASAANELDRAPSSLSYQIQKLEQDLDIMIFDRSGHKANFTDAGKLILEEEEPFFRRHKSWLMMPVCWLMVGSWISRWRLTGLFQSRTFLTWWMNSVK